MPTKRNARSNVLWFSILKGVLIASLASLVLMFLLALAARFINISDGVITAANQVIKVVSILLGTFIALRDGGTGYITGLVIGFGYMALGLILFMAFAQTLLGTASLLGGLGLGAMAGLFGGMLLAGFRK